MAAPERGHGHVQNRQMIGHEEGIEPGFLEPLDQVLEPGEVEVGIGPGAWITPGTGVNADRPHESAELELANRTHDEDPVEKRQGRPHTSGTKARRTHAAAIQASVSGTG